MPCACHTFVAVDQHIVIIFEKRAPFLVYIRPEEVFGTPVSNAIGTAVALATGAL